MDTCQGGPEPVAAHLCLTPQLCEGVGVCPGVVLHLVAVVTLSHQVLETLKAIPVLVWVDGRWALNQYYSNNNTSGWTIIK